MDKTNHVIHISKESAERFKHDKVVVGIEQNDLIECTND